MGLYFEEFSIGQKVITKLWNAFKFAQPHLQEFTTPQNMPDHLDLEHQCSPFPSTAASAADPR